MHKLLLCMVFVLLLSPLGLAASKQPKADQVLAEAKVTATQEHKSIFLIFGASWCDACHTLDSFLETKEIHAIFDKYFVIARLSVTEELTGHPDRENPGAIQLLSKFGGLPPNGEVGLPFFVVLDPKGSPLATSNRPVKGKSTGEGIGFPTEPEEIAWLLTMLKNGAPGLTSAEARVIEDRLQRGN